MQTTDIDYLWNFQDAAYTGPECPHPVFPLTMTPDSVGDLKKFIMNAGSHGILPTRALCTLLTLRNPGNKVEINPDSKPIVSKDSSADDSMVTTLPLPCPTLDIKETIL